MNVKNKILITGVAGLLGSRLADWIIKNKPEYNIIEQYGNRRKCKGNAEQEQI